MSKRRRDEEDEDGRRKPPPELLTQKVFDFIAAKLSEFFIRIFSFLNSLFKKFYFYKFIKNLNYYIIKLFNYCIELLVGKFHDTIYFCLNKFLITGYKFSDIYSPIIVRLKYLIKEIFIKLIKLIYVNF